MKIVPVMQDKFNFSYEEAEEWVKELNATNHQGYSNWKIPSVEELQQLADDKIEFGLSSYWTRNTYTGKAGYRKYKLYNARYDEVLIVEGETTAAIKAVHSEPKSEENW